MTVVNEIESSIVKANALETFTNILSSRIMFSLGYSFFYEKDVINVNAKPLGYSYPCRPWGWGANGHPSHFYIMDR